MSLSPEEKQAVVEMVAAFKSLVQRPLFIRALGVLFGVGFAAGAATAAIAFLIWRAAA